MDDIKQEIINETIRISSEFVKIKNPEKYFDDIISSELSILQNNSGIKILDGEHDFDLDDGVFIYFTSPLTVMFVKDSVAKRKNIEKEIAIKLLSLSYIARTLAFQPINGKDKTITIIGKINELISKI